MLDRSNLLGGDKGALYLFDHDLSGALPIPTSVAGAACFPTVVPTHTRLCKAR